MVSLTLTEFGVQVIHRKADVGQEICLTRSVVRVTRARERARERVQEGAGPQRLPWSDPVEGSSPAARSMVSTSRARSLLIHWPSE